MRSGFNLANTNVLRSIGAALLLLMTLAAALPVAGVAATTTLHVTDCADSGPNTLRGLIASASAGDTIVYDQDCTTSLTNGTLTIWNDLTIDGGSHDVVLDGHHGVTVLDVKLDATATISNVTIQHGYGGSFGILGGGITNSGTLNLIAITMQNNTADGGGGGIRSYGPLTVQSSTFLNNVASDDGGGIDAVSTLVIANSTFSGNKSSLGGGIKISTSEAMTISNTTFVNNVATDEGGGIYDVTAPLVLTNVIVAKSTGGDLAGTLFSGTHNLIDDDTISAITGSDNIQANPLLGPLGDYGGPTQTFPLLIGSPAINAGDDGTCSATGDGAVNGVDQRGVSRTFNGACDIGAFETRGFTLTSTSGGDQSATVGTPFANPLVATLTENGGNALPGVVITFTSNAGTDGQSATLSTPSVTDANGQASVTVTANDTPGDYDVTASIGAGPGTFGFVSVDYPLTNTPLPDVTPPVTSALTTNADGSFYAPGNWTKQAVTVKLSADDSTAATNDIDSGVAYIFYTLDGGDEQTYTGAFTISTDGDHTLTYHSVDNATNSESATTIHIMVDTTPPTITYSGNQGTYTIDQNVNITCLAVDAGSGLAGNDCADITGSALSFGVGMHTFSATASDVAGNSTTVSTTFTVGVTVDNLVDLTTQYTGSSQSARLLVASLRLVTLADRLHSPRLKAVAVNAYIVLLNFQRGHALTPQEVATLTQLARAL
jgi:hypothetical protein